MLELRCMNKKKLLTIIIAALVLITMTGYLNARFINPGDFHIRYVNISDETVSESFDGFSVVFISDIEYGSYLNGRRLEKLKKLLSGLDADIVIFGGDLFDRSYSPVTEDIELMTQLLSSIPAPYGRFAILGDYDLISESRTTLVRKILADAQFELLDGNPLKIHYGSSAFINLTGFDYSEELRDTSATFNAFDPQVYTITVVHGAEFAQNLPSFAANLAVSGHSHHVQVHLPFFNDYDSYSHTGNLSAGRHKLAAVPLLYVSHGLGTTGKDYRFFSDPEILFFRFKK